MKTSLYSITVPVFVNTLSSLSSILDKAEAHLGADGLAAAMQDRLYEDMFPLGKQVEVARDNAKGLVARLTGNEAPSFEDGNYDKAALQASILDAIAFLNSVTEADFEGAEDRQIVLKYFPGKAFTGFDYAVGYAMPNFFFHTVTAYGILRKNGVPLGKADYIGAVTMSDI